MEPISALALAVAGLSLLTLAILLLVRRPLLRLLQELCGADHRARFWLNLYQAMLFLAVVTAALLRPPLPQPPQQLAGAAELLGTLRFGLSGLLLSLGFLAWVVLVSIARHDRRRESVRPLPRGPHGEPA